MNLANVQVYLFMAHILALFEVRPPLDENGAEKMPPLEYTSTFVWSVLSAVLEYREAILILDSHSFPKPFVCRFVPRKTEIANQMLLSV